jgi:ABC-type nitrate/sulfonate/bicarbonate transport system substrate-binding protein
VIAAVLGGAPLVSIMSLVNRPLVSAVDAAGDYRVEELRGKTWGVSRFGSVTDNMTRILLRKKKFLERVPLLESEAIAPIVEFMVQKADRRGNHCRQLYH